MFFSVGCNYPRTSEVSWIFHVGADHSTCSWNEVAYHDRITTNHIRWRSGDRSTVLMEAAALGAWRGAGEACRVASAVGARMNTAMLCTNVTPPCKQPDRKGEWHDHSELERKAVSLRERERDVRIIPIKSPSMRVSERQSIEVCRCIPPRRNVPESHNDAHRRT